MTTLAQRAASVVRRTFAPRTKLTGSQWANKYGWIARSSGAAEPGQYSTDRAPYLAEILDVMCDETHRDVVLNKPAQVGFTEALIQFTAYVMAEDPSGLIVIRPSIDDAKAWMKERVDPMLAESPKLKDIIRSEGGRRTSDDTMQRKVYRGGWMVAVGANSPTGLRSRPSRRVLGDERSGWTLDARHEGDPWDLALERTSTFWNAKRIQGSTPGEEGVCPITAALKASDWREYHVVCPNCSYAEPFRWRTPDGKGYRLVCDKDPANQIIPATAKYLCIGCGVLIPESEKPRMERHSSGARWKPKQPGREMTGFDMNGLISPWRPWKDVAEMWLKTEGGRNQEKLKVFVTHVLAEPWQNPGERIDATALAARAVETELPDWVGACFAFVDVQKDRLVLLVLGAGAGEEVIVWKWDEANGDPTKPETWAEAREILLKSHGDVPIYGTGIDTGYLTDHCWKAVDLWNHLGGLGRVIGTKGEDGKGRPWIQKPGMVTSRRVRRPWLLGTETAKDALQLRLLNPVPPGGPNAVHFAESLDPAFFDQLTSEERKIILVRGRQTRAWRPISKDRANDGLDGVVGAMGTMYASGPQFLAQLGRLAAQRQQPTAEKHQPEADPDTDPDTGIRYRPKPRGGYVGRWRGR